MSFNGAEYYIVKYSNKTGRTKEVVRKTQKGAIKKATEIAKTAEKNDSVRIHYAFNNRWVGELGVDGEFNPRSRELDFVKERNRRSTKKR